MHDRREEILHAARRLTEVDGVPSMSHLAREVGLSRQGLYLHFSSRTALLLALVDHVDRQEDLDAEVARLQAAPDGASAVRAATEMQARRNPRIAAFARVLNAARIEDEEAAAAWRDRTAGRRRGAEQVVDRLVDEGAVHADWDHEDAVVLLWELTSFPVWDDLVNEAGLAPDRYVQLVTGVVLAGLAAPPGGG
ncbi:TetR/AcrR family transcriptional regulator [Salsipaludibacter albus]|uniref:TetR/AcrR family transcriptional regulator n=1 Tax=Salsipaludibacter albus TaxID=2849650 RepID=UPI001EE48594|nr:TetR/AcrR family transcriptional regulator [Salsipaludibacter albus]